MKHENPTTQQNERIRTKLNLPKSTFQQILTTTNTITENLRKHNLHINQKQHQRLIQKLALHTRANHHHDPQTITEAILAHPHILDTPDKPHLHDIIHHTTHETHWAQVTQRTTPTPTIAITQLTPHYYLNQLLTRQHLTHNGSTLNHCLETRSLTRYHQKLTARKLTIYAINTNDHTPVVTIIIDHEKQGITQIKQHNDQHLNGTEPHYQATLQALKILITTPDATNHPPQPRTIKFVQDLEHITEPTTLLNNGETIPTNQTHHHHPNTILGGTIIRITPTTTNETLQHATTLPQTIDTTDATTQQRKRITHTQGNLIDQRQHINDYPNLTSIHGQLQATNATTIHLPNLTTVTRGIYLNNATDIQLPNLKSIGGRMDAPKTLHLNLPNLTSITGKLDAENATTINLPNLTHIGYRIHAPNAPNTT